LLVCGVLHLLNLAEAAPSRLSFDICRAKNLGAVPNQEKTR
jgi:hypothetical protein